MDNLMEKNTILLIAILSGVLIGCTGTFSDSMPTAAVGVVIIIACIIVSQFIFKCPYCKKNLGLHFFQKTRQPDGSHVCPHCHQVLKEKPVPRKKDGQ